MTRWEGARSTRTSGASDDVELYKPNTDLLATIDYPTQADVALSYTTDGQLQQVQDGNGTTTYERDNRGRLKQVTWPTPRRQCDRADR